MPKSHNIDYQIGAQEEREMIICTKERTTSMYRSATRDQNLGRWTRAIYLNHWAIPTFSANNYNLELNFSSQFIRSFQVHKDKEKEEGEEL